jgi:pSer/pThr/pTyr-binding forkhead associated (FHA) protein
MAYRLIATLDGFRRRIPLAQGENTVGSRPGCDVHLDDRTVSRQHALLIDNGDCLVVRDLDSRNGTWVDGQRVTEAELAPSLPLQFGAVAAEIERVEAEDLETGLQLADTWQDETGDTAGVSATFSTSGFGPGEAFALDHLPPPRRPHHRGHQPGGSGSTVGGRACSRSSRVSNSPSRPADLPPRRRVPRRTPRSAHRRRGDTAGPAWGFRGHRLPPPRPAGRDPATPRRMRMPTRRADRCRSCIPPRHLETRESAAAAPIRRR